MPPKDKPKPKPKPEPALPGEKEGMPLPRTPRKPGGPDRG